MARALIIGASGGIGSAVAAELAARGADVTALSRRADGLDITDEGSVAACLERLEPPFDTVFIATGVLTAGARPEKALSEIGADALARLYAINAVGPMLVVKHALRLLPRERRAVLAALSARVGSIGDNRAGGWHAYRASKAALNQLMRGAAIELRRTHPQAIAVCLHPGTVETPFTRAYAGRHPMIPPTDAARRLVDTMEALRPVDTGGFFDNAGDAIPW